MMKTLTFCLGALRTNTYFCFDGDGACVVIDPGMDGEGIWEKLCQKGLRPSHILLTHGHFDHSQGVKFLAEKSGALVCIHREDATMLSNPGHNSSSFYYRGDTSFYPRTQGDILLNDGDVIQSGTMRFQVLHTPGHTPGSVCYLSQDMLFCGDTAFAYGYGRYDLWGGDKSALSASLFRLSTLPGELKLCPGHGNSATLSRIRENLKGFAEELK